MAKRFGLALASATVVGRVLNGRPRTGSDQLDLVKV